MHKFYKNIRLYNILILFSIIIPFTIKSLDLYLISLLSIVFIIYIKFNYTLKLKEKNTFYIISIFILVYSIYIIILTIYIKPNLLIYTVNKCIPLFLFLSLIIYFSNKEYEIKRIKDVIMFSILGICIISIGFYFMGIDGIKMGIHPQIITKSENLEWYSERRMTWLYEHKLKFSTMCMIGTYFAVFNESLSRFKKYILILIFIISIFLSNSKTSLPTVIIIIISNFILNLFKKMKSIKDMRSLFYYYITLCITLIISIFSILLTPRLIAFIGETRDLESLGLRTIIWEYAISDIIKNPMGIIKSYGIYLNSGYSNFTTAHNLILNECLETGIIGVSLFIIIFVLAFIMIKGVKNKLIFIVIFALAQVDYLISGTFVYIFWILMALLVADKQIIYTKHNILKIKRYEEILDD